MASTQASRVGREEAEEEGSVQRGLQDLGIVLCLTEKLREYE